MALLLDEQDDKTAKYQKLQARYDAWKPKFPNVQGIDAQKLRTWIFEENPWEQKGLQLVLVDVRNPEEHQVSMIPSGCTMTKSQFEARQAEFKHTNAQVVVYCTAGLRSGLYAAKLVNEAGFKEGDVWNLEGSILAWTLLDLPVVKQVTSWLGTVEMVKCTETREVHTCLPGWAQYLNASYTPVVTMSLLGKLQVLVRTFWDLLLAYKFIYWMPEKKKSA